MGSLRDLKLEMSEDVLEKYLMKKIFTVALEDWHREDHLCIWQPHKKSVLVYRTHLDSFCVEIEKFQRQENPSGVHTIWPHYIIVNLYKRYFNHCFYSFERRESGYGTRESVDKDIDFDRLNNLLTDLTEYESELNNKLTKELENWLKELHNRHRKVVV
jgi:hypothetical protein